MANISHEYVAKHPLIVYRIIMAKFKLGGCLPR